MGSQRVDGQDALIREAPLAAGNEDGEQLTVCRDVAAGIVVDLTVWHQNVDGGWTGGKQKTTHITKSESKHFGLVAALVTVSNYLFGFSIEQKVKTEREETAEE